MNHIRANKWYSSKIITINNNLQLNAILRLTLQVTWLYGPHSCLHNKQDANVLSKMGTCTLPEFLHWAPIPELTCLFSIAPCSQSPLRWDIAARGPRRPYPQYIIAKLFNSLKALSHHTIREFNQPVPRSHLVKSHGYSIELTNQHSPQPDHLDFHQCYSCCLGTIAVYMKMLSSSSWCKQ